VSSGGSARTPAWKTPAAWLQNVFENDLFSQRAGAAVAESFGPGYVRRLVLHRLEAMEMKRFAMLLFVPVVVLSIALAGCGKAEDKTNGDGDPQQPADPAEKSDRPTPEGTLRGPWRATFEVDEEELRRSTEADFEADGTTIDSAVLDAEVKKEMKRLESGEITLVFREDGTSTMTIVGLDPEPQTEEGTWEILLVNKNIVKLKLTGESGSPREVELAFAGVEHFTMTWPTPLPIKPFVFDKVE